MQTIKTETINFCSIKELTINILQNVLWLIHIGHTSLIYGNNLENSQKKKKKWKKIKI
jgi:hypothetical protein